MDIVYAAEKSSIAKLLSEFTQVDVGPQDIMVAENPEETGSFFIGFHFDQFVLSPNGEIQAEELSFLD
jgi:hypothetical protein